MHRSPDPGSTTIPIVEEQAQVDREVSETGAVRIRIRAERHHQLIDSPILHSGYRVERVERNATVQQRSDAWYEGPVMVVPVYEEVVIKQLILKEEVRLVPITVASSEQHNVELVRERPIFQRRDAQGLWHEVTVDTPGS